MLSAMSLVRWQITCSGLTISTEWSTTMSPAVTTPLPFLDRVRVTSSPECWRMATSLRLRRTSITSSCRPSRVVYSCSTPSISTSMMALPGIDESSTRRSALPRVWPKPRSSGSTTTLARLAPSCSTLRPRGRSTLVDETAMQGSGKLLRIQLDDQGFVDVRRQIAAVGHRLEGARELLGVHFEPDRTQVHGVEHGRRFLHAQLGARALGQRDLVARLDLVRGDVDLLAVDQHRLVGDQLAGLGAVVRDTHAVDDVVQAALEQAQQILAGVALEGRRLGVVVAELTLEHAVDALDLLLLAQLVGVVGHAHARVGAMLAGLVLQLALGVQRTGRALQAEIRTLAAGELAGSSTITGHSGL